MSDRLYKILERGEFSSLDFNKLSHLQPRRLFLYLRNVCSRTPILDEDKTILTKFFKNENSVVDRDYYLGLVNNVGNGGQEAKELRDYFTDKFRNP